MCVCAYVCACVGVCTCERMCVHVNMYACICTRVIMCEHVCTHVNMYVCVCVCMCAHSCAVLNPEWAPRANCSWHGLPAGSSACWEEDVRQEPYSYPRELGLCMSMMTMDCGLKTKTPVPTRRWFEVQKFELSSVVLTWEIMKSWSPLLTPDKIHACSVRAHSTGLGAVLSGWWSLWSGL